MQLEEYACPSWNRNSAAVYTATCISGSLSILGGGFIVFSFLKFPQFRQDQSNRLLVILSLCNIGISVSYMMRHGDNHVDLLCQIQSLLNIFSNQSSFFWTDFLALFLLVSKQRGPKAASKMVPVFHAICWIWCIGVDVTAAGVGLIGYDDSNAANWCWIKSEVWPKWGPFIAGKFVEWGSTLCIVIVYMMVYIQSKRHETMEPLIVWPTQKGKRDEEKRLMLVPIVFIILRLPGNMRTMYSLKTGCTFPSLTIAILHAIGDSAQGFANFLLFGVFNPRVKEMYRNWYSGPKILQESFEHGSVRRLVEHS